MTDISNGVRFSFRKVDRIPVGTVNAGSADAGRKNNVIQFYPEDRPKPSVQMKQEDVGLTAIYGRLSQEDRFSSAERESNSISNQKKMLEKYCRDHGYSGIRFYEDDGYSGTTFDRPGFQQMLSDIKEGRITRVIVKDMSRLGRDYLQVGMFTDILFPELGVHFVAVNDGVDSKRGDSEFTAIRNIFNEMYASDTSKKTKSVLHAKGKSGGRLSVKPPYGYIKAPDAKDKWLVDEEAAAVVQKIFSLCAGGMGPRKIAKWLREHEVLCPSAYFMSKGIPTSRKPSHGQFYWSTETVISILGRLEYLGHTVNFKSSKPSYKSKKVIRNNPEEWLVFEGTQEPIIDESVFYIVQNIRKNHQKRRPAQLGEPPMFSGIAYCGDCGGKMYQQRSSSKDKRYDALICSTYKKALRTGDERRCNTHSIRSVVLEKIVLNHLNEAIAHVSHFRDEFIRSVSDSETQEQRNCMTKKRKTLARAEARIAEIDNIICNLYEDNVNGKLSDKRFVQFSARYEQEQAELNEMAEVTRKGLNTQERSRVNARDFVALTKKYTEIKELDATVLREFIERIEVFQIDNETKARKIEIVYNFIGAFDFEGFGKAITLPKQTKKQIVEWKAV
jgi:DNA invertase Pin-like site-specific DNA recombinase